MYFGKTGFSGMSLAPAFVFSRAQLQIPEALSQDPKADLQKTHQAINQVKESLQALSENQETTSDARDILEAHLLMLEDPEWICQIEDKIQNQKQNPLKSVHETGLEFKAMMESLEDDYLRARAQDVMDLTYQVLAQLQGQGTSQREPNSDYVLVAQDILPSEFLKLTRSKLKGLVLENVSTTSHTVILAKTFELPTVVALSQATQVIRTGDLIGLDGLKGQVLVNPDSVQKSEILKQIEKQAQEKEELQKYVNLRSVSADGVAFEVASNLSSLADAEIAKKKGTEGCGLFRTEFLLMDRGQWPTQDEQTKIYSEIIRLMSPHKTIIRLFDVGGDKTLPYLKMPHEENPFLGLRGLRLLLKHPDLLKDQLKALIRASVEGPVGIMAPMVTTQEEVHEFRRLFRECSAELVESGGLRASHAASSEKIELGIMVEVPAIALQLRELSAVLDFVSVGTNDLIQYLCATDRMNSEVASLHDAFNPGVLRFLKLISDQLHGTSTWMGMCGELAGLTGYVPLLMALGFRELSVSPGSLLKTRAKVLQTSVSKSQALLDQALSVPDREALRNLVLGEGASS